MVTWEVMVPRRRLELPRHRCHTDLNRARLPIPPPGQVVSEGCPRAEVERDIRADVRCQPTFSDVFVEGGLAGADGCAKARKRIAFAQS
ncbi:hypothetical protein MTBLM5_80096 [Magnetospirillum sp. LM-5]|nr:hypothetical protein MTBLM5_80096 [Magnetospirillum sp. LM-5]